MREILAKKCYVWHVKLSGGNEMILVSEKLDSSTDVVNMLSREYAEFEVSSVQVGHFYLHKQVPARGYFFNDCFKVNQDMSLIRHEVRRPRQKLLRKTICNKE
jgi:hypothetical protein